VEWLVGAAPASALSARLTEVRLAMVFFDTTYAQYRSEPADQADSTDWLAVGVATIRAARGAAAARRWSDGTSDLPWTQLRLDIQTTGHHIADQYRYAAEAVQSGEPPVRGSAPDQAAIRAGLAETASEPDHGAHPDGALRAVEAWGWLWWLSDDLNRLQAEPHPDPALEGK
jgi:hypothetical protein